MMTRTVGPRDDPMGEFHYIVEVNSVQYVLVISDIDTPICIVGRVEVRGRAEELWTTLTGFTRPMFRRCLRRGEKFGTLADYL